MDPNLPPESSPAPKPETLVNHHASAVLGVCLAWTRNVHDAEDTMQETLLKAISKFDTLRDPNRIRPWLMQIARRVCLDYHGKRPPTQPLTDQTPAPKRFADPRIEQLHEAISELPEEYREVICLYYLDGRSSVAVAESLDLSPAAVRQRLVRARLMLHDLMKEEES